MARPDERKFVTFARGAVRDSIILQRFRNVLRTKVNPDTGVLFTEPEIAYITQEDSRFFVEADAIDLFGQATQQRAIWFADQVRPERAASDYLQKYHGALWLPDGMLPATGGSGHVTATGSAGTIYVGSSAVGDPGANIAHDPAGYRYQVLSTAQIAIGQTSIALNFIGVDTGDRTNPPAGTELTWDNPPLGSDPTCVVLEDFNGGFNAETDADFAKRILRRIRHKPGAGNAAQFRLWAEQSSVAVETAFVYPCAFHSGSVLVVVAQKRGSAVGPWARLASVGTLAAVTSFLVPPRSPVVPHGNHVLVVSVEAMPDDIALRLGMPKGSSGGWRDVNPWPVYSPTYPFGTRVTAVADALHFTIQNDQPLPGAPLSGANVPSMAIWHIQTGEFVTLDVASVASAGANLWAVTLNNAPAYGVNVSDVVSPVNERADIIASALIGYFDSLGPGEGVLATDTRYVRAARFPRPDQEYPVRAGQTMITALDEVLGGALTDASLDFIVYDTPHIPTSDSELALGTALLTLGHVGIYPFDS